MAISLFHACELGAQNEHRHKKEFDCVAVFDLFTGLAAPQCPRDISVQERAPEINEAISILSEFKFIDRTSFDNIRIAYCPLINGLGIVPQSDIIYLDDGLRNGSADTLAEVLFHELQHVTQMREMGSDKFKCGYINELIACGGCTDNNHALEAPAYAAQSKVRDLLLKRWLEAH